MPMCMLPLTLCGEHRCKYGIAEINMLLKGLPLVAEKKNNEIFGQQRLAASLGVCEYI